MTGDKMALNPSDPGKNFGFLALLFLASQFFACSSQPLDASKEGSGTNTGNSISARFIYENDWPAAKVVARIRPEDYRSHPDDSSWLRDSSWANSSTDSLGNLEMTGIPSGKYLLELNDLEGYGWMNRIGFNFDSSLLELGDRVLNTNGEVVGVVPLAPNFDQAYAQIVGLESHAWVDPDTWVFSLPGVPAGNYELMVVGVSHSTTLLDTTWIQIFPGVRTTVMNLNLSLNTGAYAQWKQSAQIQMNNYLLGLSPSTRLEKFPIALRLTGGDISFDEFLPGGSDVRFSSALGDSLPYEIEYWDAGGEQALVWVQVDTLFGSLDSQTLNIHWSNPLAQSLTDGAEVFSLNHNYHGVWHMNALSATDSNVNDASEKSNIAVIKQVDAGLLGDSLLGSAVVLNGSDQYFSTSILDTNPNGFTLSLWFKTSSIQGGKLLGYGWPDTGSAYANYERQLWMTDLGTLHFGVFMDSVWRTGWPGGNYPDSFYVANIKQISTTTAYNDGNWHFAAIVLSGNGMELYLDGTLQAFDATVTYGAFRPGYWRIGAGPVQLDSWWRPWPSSVFFNGSLDEVRIQYRRQSPEWIRASFESQSSGNRVFSMLP